MLYIEGRLKFDQWEDKQGGGKRSKLSVVVENFQFLGGREGGGGGGGGGSAPAGEEDQTRPAGAARRSVVLRRRHRSRDLRLSRRSGTSSISTKVIFRFEKS
jgi:single-stranded DNA-binding protein